MMLALLLSPHRMPIGHRSSANGLSVWETASCPPPPTPPRPTSTCTRLPLHPALPPLPQEAKLLPEEAFDIALADAVPQPSLSPPAYEADSSTVTPTLPLPAPDSLGESPHPTKTRPAQVSTPAAHPASAGENAVPPSYDDAPEPPYPPALRASHAEGCVRVRISVDASGRPTHVDIVKSSGFREFDSTARDWILKHWRFHPAHYRGKAIDGIVSTSIHFVP